MKQLIVFLGVLFFCFYSCDTGSQYPGYSKTEEGFYYKLLRIGTDTIKPDYGDYITANITYKTMNDSVFFNGIRRFQLTKPDGNKGIGPCLRMLAEGDKANFIMSADSFFTTTLGSQPPDFLKKKKMKITVRMKDIKTPEQYNQEKHVFLHWIDDFGKYEETLRQQYLKKHDINAEPTESGLYHIIKKEGNDKEVEKGDTLIFHYEGKFLNGKYFDSSRDRGSPFRMIYGQEWQVVEGLEEGLGLMHEGEKAILILPSDLAFGKTGSSTGIIPPCTTIIYEVNLLEIKKAS